MLDAALTGGVRGAEAGEINLLVGGDEQVLDRIRPVLEPWCGSVHHMGALGTGQVGKTVNNLVHWAQISAINEALRFGQRLGVAPSKLREALKDGPTDSRTLREIEQMRFTWHKKDLANAFAMAQTVEPPIELPVAATAREAMLSITVDSVAALLARQAARHRAPAHGLSARRRSRPMPQYRVAVDTGGTFTDFVFLREDTGELSIAKRLSTPHDPSVAIMEGVEHLLASPDAEGVTYFCHGTTVGTNALLEEKGVRTGLLVSEGFRGIYEVMEQSRPHGPALFDLNYKKPALLAPQSRTGEVRERVDYRGAVLRPPRRGRPADDAARARRARTSSPSPSACSSATCTPAHEQRVREIIGEELPGCVVSLSSDVLPQIREYARLSTTVINAYLQPILERYLRNLRTRLVDVGVTTAQAYVMQSNGGTATFDKAAQKAAATLLSGPAGGVTAGARLSRMCGVNNIITFDMGGTSCDVALIEGGAPRLTNGGLIAGRQVALPGLDIDTVSAGGGTLAGVDAQGVLKVGPDSAGSVPGPACYGRGGTRPTVTDANLVLGYLSARSRLGGSLALDTDAARRPCASTSPTRWAWTSWTRPRASSTSSTSRWRRPSRASPPCAATTCATSSSSASAAPAPCTPPR